jgi:uncharacterized membrane protein YdbT with pleckstrin-like domain
MTSYVQKVLQPGESVLHQAKLSWVMYLPGLFVLIGAGVVFGLSRAIFGAVWWADIVSLIIAAIGLYLVAAEWFERWTTEIAITDRRVIFKRGFIRRDTIEMAVEKVESVDVNQSLLGRLFDFGDITVHGTGTGLAPIRNIDAPLDFRSHITGLAVKPPEAAPAKEA